MKRKAYRPRLEDPAYMVPDDNEIENPYIMHINPFNGTTSFQSESGYKFILSIMIPVTAITIIVAWLLMGPIYPFGFLILISVASYLEYRVGRANAERYKRERKR